MKIVDLKDKNVAIWGEGRETNYFLKVMKSKFPNKQIAIINDENAKEKLKKNIDIVVRSPGVSIYKKEIVNAKKRGVQFITEKSLFFEEMKDRNVITIAITGTKGKTTTSTFCAYMLEKLGYRVFLAGNLGKPTLMLLEEIDRVKYDFVVVEISSYQASDLISFPNYSIILNLFPEHLQWHKTHSNYYRDKCYLLYRSQFNIINYKNKKLVKLTQTYGNRYFFGNNQGVHYKYNYFYDNKTKLFNTQNMKLLGKHNYENICSILTLFKLLKIDLATIRQEYFDDFKPIEHRMEIIKVGNRTFVNDSISTIPEATIACYKIFINRNIYGILGGFDRRQNYKKLISFIVKNKNNIKYLTLLGQTSSKISDLLKKNNFNNYTLCDNLQQCVEILCEKSRNDENGVMILSPASPSYDMFKNFEERGEMFRKYVKEKL